MFGLSKKIELPYLYAVALIANIGTFCLVASGFFLPLKMIWYGFGNSSNELNLSQSEIDTLVFSLYLIASSLSGEYIESVLEMARDPKQFYSNIRLKTRAERYYTSKAAFIQSVIFTTVACCSLLFLNQKIVPQVNVALFLVLVVIVNVICFGVIHYYKKFYR